MKTVYKDSYGNKYTSIKEKNKALRLIAETKKHNLFKVNDYVSFDTDDERYVGKIKKIQYKIDKVETLFGLELFCKVVCIIPHAALTLKIDSKQLTKVNFYE